MSERYEHLLSLHRLFQISGTISAIVLALLLVGTNAGRNTVAWLYLQSAEIITNVAHIGAFPLDSLDPTCPQCM